MNTYPIHKHLRWAALFGAAALAALACSREAELEPDLSLRKDPAASRTVRFHATEVETKAQFGNPDQTGERPTLWTANGPDVKVSLNYASAVEASVTPANGGTSASFSADITYPEGNSFTFYSISPATAAQALSLSRTAWKVSIPCVQNPSATSVDEAALIIAAKSNTYNTAVDDVELVFNHLTAYGRFSLSNLSLANDETITSVELTTTTPIVGDWYWNTSGTSIEDYGASSTLTINTSSASDIWFACAPVSVSEEVLVVTVNTNKGTYEQMTMFPENCAFTAGQVAVFTVNMYDAEFNEVSAGDFALVTDASTLQVGDEIIIANVDANYALGQAMSTTPPFRQGVEISSFGTVLTSIGNATILTLQEGSTNGTFALKTGDNYLTTSFSSDYSLSESSEITAESSWAISISGGEATIVAQDGEDSWYLCFYAGGHYFGGFVTGYSVVNPVIYRRKASGEVTEDPILAKTAYGCYLGTGYERALVSGSDQVTRSYNSNDVLTYTLLNTTSVEEVEIFGYTKSLVKGDRVVITVNWHQGTTPVLSESYTMKVVKEEGPKVWLSDGAGKGVVLKK